MKLSLIVITTFFIAGCVTNFNVPLWPEENSWPSDASSEELERLGYMDGPCGAVRYVKTNRVPPAESIGKGLSGDKVLEFNANGEVVRSWLVPANVRVLGVDNFNIVMSSGGSVIQIDQGGKLSRPDSYTPFSKHIECPEAIKSLLKSDYLMCSELSGAHSEEVRRFAYEAVCT